MILNHEITQPESIIKLISLLLSEEKRSSTASVASVPPTVAKPNATPSVTRSLLITMPARTDLVAPLTKLSEMPRTRTPDFRVIIKGLMNVNLNIM